VKRQFRLTRSIDIKRVRRSGSSFAHPLVVLYVKKTEKPETHVAVSAGMGVGNAVKRNRAKRLLRAAMNDLMPKTSPGFDLLLIARTTLPAANANQTREALASLLIRAGLLSQSYEF
jgi:ribonuclease P protein component